MTDYLIIQGIAAALLWSLAAICYLWNAKAQTLTSHNASVLTFFTALTFTGYGVLNIVTLAVVQ